MDGYKWIDNGKKLGEILSNEDVINFSNKVISEGFEPVCFIPGISKTLCREIKCNHTPSKEVISPEIMNIFLDPPPDNWEVAKCKKCSLAFINNPTYAHNRK